MSTKPLRARRFSFVLLAALPACSAFGADDGTPVAPASETPAAPPVITTPDVTEITEAFGVFVAPSGSAQGHGTRARPLGTIQAGIDAGKRAGKRVYVCGGTFAESLTLADSISIIGSLDCEGESWKFGGARTRIDAPSGPAILARAITAPTRLEGLDVIAPNGAQPSASSIGLLADHSPGITLASCTITANNGAAGVDGTEATPLTGGPNRNGVASRASSRCVQNVTCTQHILASTYPWMKPSQGAYGGDNACGGHPAGSGGRGGSGGLFQIRQDTTRYEWVYYGEQPMFAPELGEQQTGTAGDNGTSAIPGASMGTLTAAGYVALAGLSGTDGAPGKGGSGGKGSTPSQSAFTVAFADVYTGTGGPGGGAGGCPGLAGTPGTGGGASLAIALVESPIVLDATQVIAGRGGAGGAGTFGSDPTMGGEPGTNTLNPPEVLAAHGGAGGASGISTNGSNGPSVGILHVGAAPTLRSGAKVTVGRGAPPIDARSHADALGHAKMIPTTPAGVVADVVAL